MRKNRCTKLTFFFVVVLFLKDTLKKYLKSVQSVIEKATGSKKSVPGNVFHLFVFFNIHIH